MPNRIITYRLGIAILLVPQAGHAQRIDVEPPVIVSPTGAGSHFFTYGNTQADPDDSLRLITCGIRQRQDPLSWEGYLYASQDGGRTWRVSYVDSTPSIDLQPNLVSETSCALGRTGQVFMVTMVWGRYYEQPFHVMHSADGGYTWDPPLRHAGWFDYTRTAIDNWSESYRGRLYVFGNASLPSALATGKYKDTAHVFNGIMAVSADSGRSLREPVNYASREYTVHGRSHGLGEPTQAIVLRDGTVLAAYGTGYPHTSQAVVVASRDGGRSVLPPVVVGHRDRSRGLGQAHTDSLGLALLAGLGRSVAVDRSHGPLRDRVYLSWVEAADARVPVSRVMLSSSADGGITWSPPRRVDDAPRQGVKLQGASAARWTDPTTPSVAVGRDGVLGLMWGERTNSCWRFSVSRDGGRTFLPSVAVNDCPRPHRPGTQWIQPYLWSTDGLAFVDPVPDRLRDGPTFSVGVDVSAGEGALTATTDGVFHPTWIVPEDGAVWTTRIIVNEGAASSGRLTTVAGLHDVSSRARLEVRSVYYDEPTHEVFVDLVLVNTTFGVVTRMPSSHWRDDIAQRGRQDSATLGRPFVGVVLRLSSVRSGDGELHLVNADGFDTTGAPLLDWSAVLPQTGLAPGARSAPRRLVFRLTNVNTNLRKPQHSLVAVAASVFAN